PTKTVTALGELETTRRAQGESGASLDFGLDPAEALVIHRVFEARVLALRAVAVVTLQRDRGFRQRDDLAGPDEPDRTCHARIGFRIAVAGAHAATDQHVITGEFAILDDGDKADILGVHV